MPPLSFRDSRVEALIESESVVGDAVIHTWVAVKVRIDGESELGDKAMMLGVAIIGGEIW